MEYDVEINFKSDWAKLPRYKKRFNGFTTYIACAICSLLHPEKVDVVTFITLKEQFIFKKK